MSILGQAVSDARGAGWLELLYFLPFLAAGVILATWLGAFRRTSILGPDRIDDDEPLGSLLIGLLTGLMLWLVIPAFLLAGATPKLPEGATTVPTEPASRPAATAARDIPQDKLVVASTLSASVAFLGIVGTAAALRKRGLEGLGLAPRQLPAGIKCGLIGACVMVPLVFVAAQLTEILWQALHYEHEKQHELLKMLGESDRPVMRLVLIASAVLVAPIFEECLFRGHLQTLFAYGATRLARPRPPLPVLGGIALNEPPATVTPDYAPPTPETALPSSRPGIFVRWLAVAAASLLFALVHPAWTIPPIFVLSCCVGYAYERTGNLWTVIVMHAAFNLISTVLYLTLSLGAQAGAAVR